MLPPVQCPYCGRWFKHKGYHIRHDRDSIISCITKLKIAEQDKIHRERLKADYKEKNPTKKEAQSRRKKKWYEKHRERILEEKKEYYKNNKEKFHEYYMSKKIKID